ncbi:MAG: hypothetical protein GQ529_09755 [Methyloprofundus sp.]|nr:hypothetical protein [Methyloprofundus sp.]
MKTFISLMLGKLVYFLCIFSFSVSAQQVELEPVKLEPIQQENFNWPALKKAWDDDIQFHGFLSQGLFSSTGNNVYGKSIDSISAGLTELGLNISYQALNQLSFAAQGLYRRAGENTGSGGNVTLDCAFIDFTFFNFDNGRIGIRGGRVKNPWGLYNETRDVAFTHPTIFLPLTYFDRSRTLFLSLDGGQFYTDYNTSFGDFTFKFNYGVMNANDDELLRAITIIPASGNLKGEPSLVTQLRYDIMGGKYIFAISYAHVGISYEPSDISDNFTGLEGNFDSFILSAQYNGEKFSLAGEYNMQWNRFSGIKGRTDRTDRTDISEYWYVQAGYRILDNLQATIRYDSGVRDINDRSGEKFHSKTGLPAHFMFTQDIVVGLRWDITPSWMVRAEYQRVHGASAVSLLDNPEISELALDWNVYALQIAFRF